MNRIDRRRAAAADHEGCFAAPPRLLRLGEFAKLVGLARPTIRKWVASRRIASVKLSARAVRIPASEVGRLIQAKLRPAVPGGDADA